MGGIQHLGGEAIGFADRLGHLGHAAGQLFHPDRGALNVSRDHLRRIVLLLHGRGDRRGEVGNVVGDGID